MHRPVGLVSNLPLVCMYSIAPDNVLNRARQRHRVGQVSTEAIIVVWQVGNLPHDPVIDLH